MQSQSPPAVGGGGMGSRRGSISSLSSVTSMLEEKDDEKIRCCHHCMDTLLKRQQKLEEKDHMPDVVKLYEVGTLKYRIVKMTRITTFHKRLLFPLVVQLIIFF